jgi:hypothetical protein
MADSAASNGGKNGQMPPAFARFFIALPTQT